MRIKIRTRHNVDYYLFYRILSKFIQVDTEIIYLKQSDNLNQYSNIAAYNNFTLYNLRH